MKALLEFRCLEITSLGSTSFKSNFWQICTKMKMFKNEKNIKHSSGLACGCALLASLSVVASIASLVLLLMLMLMFMLMLIYSPITFCFFYFALSVVSSIIRFWRKKNKKKFFFIVKGTIIYPNCHSQSNQLGNSSST